MFCLLQIVIHLVTKLQFIYNNTEGILPKRNLGENVVDISNEILGWGFAHLIVKGTYSTLVEEKVSKATVV